MSVKLLKGRGNGKRKALVHVSVRLPEEVVAFYKQYALTAKVGNGCFTNKMRELLIDFSEVNNEEAN